MIKMLQCKWEAFLAARREAARWKRWQAGYDWCMKSFYEDGLDTLTISTKIQYARKTDPDGFGKGARDAMNIITWG